MGTLPSAVTNDDIAARDHRDAVLGSAREAGWAVVQTNVARDHSRGDASCSVCYAECAHYRATEGGSTPTYRLHLDCLDDIVAYNSRRGGKAEPGGLNSRSTPGPGQEVSGP